VRCECRPLNNLIGPFDFVAGISQPDIDWQLLGLRRAQTRLHQARPIVQSLAGLSLQRDLRRTSDWAVGPELTPRASNSFQWLAHPAIVGTKTGDADATAR
jgi:hypothetical protein